mgnify:CR=1 FL=1
MAAFCSWQRPSPPQPRGWVTASQMQDGSLMVHAHRETSPGGCPQRTGWPAARHSFPPALSLQSDTPRPTSDHIPEDRAPTFPACTPMRSSSIQQLPACSRWQPPTPGAGAADTAHPMHYTIPGMGLPDRTNGGGATRCVCARNRCRSGIPGIPLQGIAPLATGCGLDGAIACSASASTHSAGRRPGAGNSRHSAASQHPPVVRR